MQDETIDNKVGNSVLKTSGPRVTKRQIVPVGGLEKAAHSPSGLVAQWTQNLLWHIIPSGSISVTGGGHEGDVWRSG